MTKPKAVVLLSGGLDSATCLAIANQECETHALSFDYGQKHKIELRYAYLISKRLGSKSFREVKSGLGELGGSALTDSMIRVPRANLESKEIPATYVPGRNLILCSYGLSYAEIIGAERLYIGANAVDYSGYPDCRPAFFMALRTTSQVSSAQETPPQICTPLIGLTKAEIIRKGTELGVPYELTSSCYSPLVSNKTSYACGLCDSCEIRARGFEEAQVVDPTKYKRIPKWKSLSVIE